MVARAPSATRTVPLVPDASPARSRGAVYLHAMRLCHVAGLGQLLGVPASGSCHIFDPAGGPAAIYDALRDEGVNTIIAVPTALAMLLDSPLRDDELLARIEAVGYGATAI